jgi:ATP-dependent DNA helicase 2 subunit 2
MGEVQYVWADPRSPAQQVALSSLVAAMDDLNMYAITRWVSKDNSEPKMGVLAPCRFHKVDCFLWVQVIRLLSNYS